MGRRLLGASNTVAGVAVEGDLGWREERREEMKVMLVRDWRCRKRADWLKVVNKLIEDGGFAGGKIVRF